MPMTRPCRYWLKARPVRAGYGPMYATTGRSEAAIRQPRCSSYSPDRGAKHPEQHLASYAGLMQADAYSGFNRLYDVRRREGPITQAVR